MYQNQCLGGAVAGRREDCDRRSERARIALFLTLTLERQTYFDQRPNGFRPDTRSSPHLSIARIVSAGTRNAISGSFPVAGRPGFSFRHSFCLFFFHNWVIPKSAPKRKRRHAF
jgi:hypothetical protein